MNQMTNQSKPTSHDDEIDLKDLLKKAWNTRVFVIKTLFVVLALYVTFIGFKYFQLTDKHTRYSQVYDLTFEGLSEGKFPNGSQFIISDIASPTVLNRVYTQNNLENQNINLEDFRRNISVQPFARDIDFIRAKYQGRLADKKLNATDIENLQKQMQIEIKQAQSSSIELSLIVNQDLAIDSVLAKKLIDDIVKIWAERAIVEQGVLKANVAVYSERIFNQERFENLDYLLGMDLVLNSIKLIRENIASLKEQPNANTLIDDVSGFTLIDLDKSIQDIADYDIRQIIDPIKELGISRNPQVVKLYFERKLIDLKEEQKQWRARAQATNAVLNGEIKLDASSSASAVTSQNNLVPQLGDAFLDRLLEVSRQGSNIEFRQELTKEILKYENKSIDLDREITEIIRILASIDTDTDTDTDTVRNTYIKAVQDQLPKVLDTLREYTRVMNRIYEKQGQQNAGFISQLITAQGGTFEAQTAKIINSKDMKVLALLLVIAGFLGMLISLIKQALTED